MPAALFLLRADTLALVADDVRYEPIVGDATLGALLFALDLLEPAAVPLDGLRHADRVALQPALLAARQFGLILRKHADRSDRAVPTLPGVVRVDDLRGWVHAAAETVPEKDQERFCWRLARRLGQDPWGDGRPAIELKNQQFGLFGGDVDVDEATVDGASDAYAGSGIDAPVEPPPELPPATGDA